MTNSSPPPLKYNGQVWELFYFFSPLSVLIWGLSLPETSLVEREKGDGDQVQGEEAEHSGCVGQV